MAKETRERREIYGPRYECYLLLQDVMFEGEPVVPRITSGPRPYGLTGKVFGAQRLGGCDLANFLVKKKVKFADKINTLLLTTRQLQEIDRQGYVIFDRNPWNIRVLDSEGKSIRQVDIDTMHDKRKNIVYGSAEMDIESIDWLKQNGEDLWADTVDAIAQYVETANATSHPSLDSGYLNSILSKHRVMWGSKGTNLSALESELQGLANTKF